MTNQKTCKRWRGMVDSKKAAGKPFERCGFFAEGLLASMDFFMKMHSSIVPTEAHFTEIFAYSCGHKIKCDRPIRQGCRCLSPDFCDADHYMGNMQLIFLMVADYVHLHGVMFASIRPAANYQWHSLPGVS